MEELKKEKEETTSEKQQNKPTNALQQTQALVGVLAEEIAKTVIERLPKMNPLSGRRKVPPKPKQKKIENSVFLDTSAIIDGRIFDLINMGVFSGTFVVCEGILLELKHIADSLDVVKKDRGRKGLEALEKLKKNRKIKVTVLMNDKQAIKKKEVDEQLISMAKSHKGKLITCDYNLEKKAYIHGVVAVNVNAMAHALKVVAVPGEALAVKVLHPGKDVTQGVGYLDDGTMLVVERGSSDIGKTIDVIVARVIQTASGRILFAKKA
jgi:uncharacterized protein YacL